MEDDVAHPRLVETGISDATGVEILAGVALADTLVTGPYRSLDQLKEGTPVKRPEVPAPAVVESTEGEGEEEKTPDPAGQKATETAVASAEETDAEAGAA